MATSKKIGNIVHEAITFAHEDYKLISHGAWLWSGAEYYLTVTIAHQLFEMLNEKYPALVEYPIYKAEGKDLDPIVKPRPGRKTKELSKGSRIDCVLFDPDWNAAAAIEVKTQVYPSLIETDIKRLMEIVSHSTQNFPGIFAYWGSWDGNNAISVLNKRVDKMNKFVEYLIMEHNKKIEMKNRKRRKRQKKLKFFPLGEPEADPVYDNDAYLPYCVVIEKN